MNCSGSILSPAVLILKIELGVRRLRHPPTDLVHFFDGYNSNTYVHNMIEGAGMTPPRFRRAPGYHKAPSGWYPE